MSRTTLITRSAVALFAGAVLSIAVGTGSVRAAENSQSTTQGGPAMPSSRPSLHVASRLPAG
jgi:hypothetical protein